MGTPTTLRERRSWFLEDWLRAGMADQCSAGHPPDDHPVEEESLFCFLAVGDGVTMPSGLVMAGLLRVLNMMDADRSALKDEMKKLRDRVRDLEERTSGLPDPWADPEGT